MSEKIRVAIVGGGRTGAPLLEDFLKRPYIEVVGVADRNQDSPGAKLARERGIFCVMDADVLCAKADEIDLIIEVTGDPKVKPALKSAFQAQGNKKTIIVHDMVARLILSLSANSDELIATNHPDDEGIG